jgi:transposase-like protein
MPAPHRRWTVDQKRTIVAAYEDAPHGTKQAVLQLYGVTYERVRRWRAARDAGLLEVGAIPRQIHTTPRSQSAELRHLRAELDRVEAERDRLQRQNTQQAGALDALGKATALLQDLVASSSAHPPFRATSSGSTKSTPSKP